MDYGVVTWKMDGMGTISLEEVKIKTINSKKEFEVKMRTGEIIFCSFDPSDVAEKVFLVMENERKLVWVSDIVEIYPIKGNFWMRTSGDLSFGGNYSKGSDITTISSSGNLLYRKKKIYFNLSWNNNSTYQSDSLSSSNGTVSLAWQRKFSYNWSAETTIGMSQNTALGIKRKVGLSITGIKDLVYNSWNRLYSGAGLIIMNEIPLDDSENQDNLAGLIQVVWKVYKNTGTKVGVDANASLSPYITNWGRYISTININPYIKIFNNDFKIGFSSYYNFDNNPVSEDAETNDFGFNLQLSYTLH
jgi:hypothetical protein